MWEWGNNVLMKKKNLKKTVTRSAAQILADIDNFAPENGNWLKLDALLIELWQSEKQEEGLVNMLRVLERFPEDHGEGVLWSIVHGAEKIEGYEKELLKSVRRQPADLSVTMLQRMRNAGMKKIEGEEIIAVLKETLEHPKLPETVKETVQIFLAQK